MEVVRRVLAPSFDLEVQPRLAAGLRRDEEAIIRLTEEQFHLLDCLARNRRVEITRD